MKIISVAETTKKPHEYQVSQITAREIETRSEVVIKVRWRQGKRKQKQLKHVARSRRFAGGVTMPSFSADAKKKKKKKKKEKKIKKKKK